MAERIHFQKHPGQSGEYHHPSHGEYEPQLFLYPRTQRWSGDLEEAIKKDHYRMDQTEQVWIHSR